MTVKTPLKWVGSKSKVMTELKKFLPAGQRLVEPFGGSCAVMMATDYPAYLVADINSDLINMYQKIQQYENAFIEQAEELFAQYTTEADYYELRNDFNNNPGMTLLYRAAAFLYLNRHGHRGMCRYNRNGHFNIPFGHYKKPYFPLEEIRAFAEKAKRATFICAEFPKTLQMVKPGDVVYSDPPYEGTFSDYHTEGFDLSWHRYWKERLKHPLSLPQTATQREPGACMSSLTPPQLTPHAAWDLPLVKVKKHLK